MSWENLFMLYANNKGADQPAHPHRHSLISAFVVRCLDSIIPLVSISEISSLYLASVAAQAGLSLTWSQTQKTGFLVTRLKSKTINYSLIIIWAPSSESVSSSIPSWQILTAHAQPFRGARDLAFCLKVPLDSLLVWASSGGSGETARMRRLAWTFAARICDKYQIRLTRPI